MHFIVADLSTNNRPMTTWQKIRFSFTNLLLLTVSVLLINYLYVSVHPLAAIQIPLDATSVRDTAQQVFRTLGIVTDGSIDTPELSRNDSLVRYLYHDLGTEKGNALLRTSVPGYYWHIRWRKAGFGKTVSASGSSSSEDRNDSRQPGDVRLQFNAMGKLINFERRIDDTAHLPALPPEEAKAAALNFLHRFFPPLPPLTFDGEKRKDLGNHVDHEFTWSAQQPEFSPRLAIKVNISGDMVTSVSTSYALPEHVQEGGKDIYHGLITGLLFFGLGITMIVVGIRRIRAYDINFRLALVLAIILTTIFGLDLYTRLSFKEGWEMILPLVLGPLFYGGFFVIVWAVAETVGREAWKDKFISLDLFTRGHLLHSRVGENLVRGVVFGLISFAVWLLCSWMVAKVIPGYFALPDRESLAVFSGAVPALQVVSHAINADFYIGAFFVVFLVSLLRQRFSSPVVLIALGALSIALTKSEEMFPFPAAIVVESVTAAVIVWAFFRFDAITSLLSLITFTAASSGCAFFYAGNASLLQAGFLLAAFSGLLLIFGLVALYTRDRVTDFDAIAPAFVKHITERERLQRELEIARDVQMSFLPKQNPQYAGVEIASRCAPALEVGGDYFDFVSLGPRRFAVAVGDVSGKGTQAAFYMTLMKGFLKTVARLSQSPADVLTRLNDLFVENVERGTFISMVYGIFDLDARSLLLARAGHTPVIARSVSRDRTDFVQQGGMALGLEAGKTFARAIEETTIPFGPGDLFILYTDGFTEAMTRKYDEFGDERLRSSVEQHASGSAEEILKGIFSDVKGFIGKATQHDDMTMVVVKIT